MCHPDRIKIIIGYQSPNDSLITLLNECITLKPSIHFHMIRFCILNTFTMLSRTQILYIFY